MRNKGLVIALTLIVTLLSVYFLSFTFVSRNIVDDATAQATNADGSIDYAKKQTYLDSIWYEPVYNFLGAEYTYKEIKENELNLGLDLQGGMHVTLEVSPVEVIRGMAGNPADADLQQALDYAKEAQKTSQKSFVDLFEEGWNETTDDRRLADVFSTAATRNTIPYNAEDSDVMAVIRARVEDAIDRSFQILRTRVDRFGTSQPNIQQVPGTGRIQIELPGVDNPERVRKLLQGTAKLEFLEVAEIDEFGPAIMSINSVLVQESRLANAERTAELTETVEDIQEEATDTESEAYEATDAELGADSTGDSDDLAQQLTAPATDSTAMDSLNMQVSPLLSLNVGGQSLAYSVRDTSTINRILKRPDVQELIPANIYFVWDVKGFTAEEGDNAGETFLPLYAVKRERGGKAPLTGEAIEYARQSYDERSQPNIVMRMDLAGAKAWKKLTTDISSKNLQGQPAHRVAIVLDDYVYSAPGVGFPIEGGNTSIEGNFTIQEATDLANILEAGALPAPARIVEEATVGPTLGRAAQAQGILSIVAGLGIVILFIIAYYAKGGFVANIALLFNIFFIFGILANLNAALTLPGIAGIVLTIGMSIDANVLVFERIREELRNGLSIKAAIKKGYDKAYSSIIDANVTTLLVAIILYTLGLGPVKGFAITLIIGILCSLFTAVLITRVILEWMTRRAESSVSFDTPFSRNLFKGGNIDFMGKRRTAYAISGVVIIVGLAVLFLTGGLNMGVDFTGGRSYVVEFTEPVNPSDLKIALTDDFGGKGTEVKTYGANNILKVTTSYLSEDEGIEADSLVSRALISGVGEATGMTYVPNANELEGQQFTIGGSSKVLATIADDIKTSSLEAGLFALIAIFLYILIRFSRWQFSVGAIAALFHDVAITLSAFAIAGALGMTYEVDQVFVAAILTIIGYSINDTVVVFDRIREVMGNRSGNKANVLATFNDAINSTISRTLMTSLTTLVVVIILFLFGGEVLKGFSFALLVGILVGTYSSIFIASPIAGDLISRSKEKPEPVDTKATARHTV
jgi:SecD/SecF fusion protein